MVTFETCLRCDPYFCIGHFQLAYLLQRIGRTEGAVLHYNNAIQVSYEALSIAKLLIMIEYEG